MGNIAARSRFILTKGALAWPVLPLFVYAAGTWSARVHFTHGGGSGGETMTDNPERDIADQIEREVASKNGLLALVLCLSVTVGLAAAGVATLLGAI
jgi:hypothetical protein